MRQYDRINVMIAYMLDRMLKTVDRVGDKTGICVTGNMLVLDNVRQNVRLKVGIYLAARM